MEMPRDIRRFEALQLATVVIGLIHGFAISDNGLVGGVAAAFIVATLTVLVSRRRSYWSRALLLVMFVGGLMFMLLWPQAVLARGYVPVTIAVTLMQAAALAFSFTKQSSGWLRRALSPA